MYRTKSLWLPIMAAALLIGCDAETQKKSTETKESSPVPSYAIGDPSEELVEQFIEYTNGNEFFAEHDLYFDINAATLIALDAYGSVGTALSVPLLSQKNVLSKGGDIVLEEFLFIPERPDLVISVRSWKEGHTEFVETAFHIQGYAIVFERDAVADTIDVYSIEYNSVIIGKEPSPIRSAEGLCPEDDLPCTCHCIETATDACFGDWECALMCGLTLKYCAAAIVTACAITCNTQ